MNGLHWYQEVSMFLKEHDCYLTTPIMDKDICKELREFARGESCPIYRVNTEYRKYGLYVFRGKHGNSMMLEKPVVEIFCENKDFTVEGLLRTNQILPFSSKDFCDCRHLKNLNKIERKQISENIKQKKRSDILNDPKSSPESKRYVMLDIWSDKKLKNDEIATSEYETTLFNKLYAVYRRRVKKQQKFIIRNRVYFVDIYMKAYKVAIEVDGGYHNTPEQIERDRQKDIDLSTKGLAVIRIKNEDVNRRFKMLTKILDTRHKDIIRGAEVPKGSYKL